MAIASKRPLQRAGRKRGSRDSDRSLRTSISKSRSRRARKVVASSCDSQSVAARDNPSLEELRRARTAFFSQKPEDRQKAMDRETAHQRSRGKELGPKSVSSRGSKVGVHKSNQRHYSDRRRRRRRHRETDGESGKGYVYSPAGNTREASAAAMPRSTRRVSGSVASSGKGEHRRTDRPKMHRPKMHRPEARAESLHRRVSRKGGDERRSSLYTTETVVRTIKRRSTSADVAASARTPKPRVTRTTSMREPPSAPRAPPGLRTNTADSIRIVRLPKPQAGTPSVSARTESISATQNWVGRGTGLLGTFFGPRVFVPDEMIQCLTCLSEDVPQSKSALLACGHRMCHDCLKRIFIMSTTDPQHMPPKCCTTDHIPLKHVERLFSDQFKIKWNKKFQEYSTKNRVYCPARGCGEWIKPANIHIDASGGANGGRKYGKCGRCKTKVCCACNGKWHIGRECPNDEDTQRFVEVAKAEGWQRCFNCSAMVELKEGCNHMTCRCRAEFCMICGLRWKTCDCPWFSYEAAEHARLQHVNGPQARIHVGRMPGNAGPVHAPGYNAELERRREQERRDEALARRIQQLGIDDDDVVMPHRPARRTRVPRPPPTPPPPVPPVPAPRHQQQHQQQQQQQQQQRRPPNNIWTYILPTDDTDTDASFIDTRPHVHDLQNLMHHHGAANLTEQEFLRRARHLFTAPQTPAAERAASDFIAELGTARDAAGAGAANMPPPPRPHLRQQFEPMQRVPPARFGHQNARVQPERARMRREGGDEGVENARTRPAMGVAPGGRAEAAGPGGMRAEVLGGMRAAAGGGGERRHSAMAGLTRRTGSGRVEEWRRYVDVDGDPSLGPEMGVGE